MIKLSVEEYKHGQVYFVKKGYSKHYLYFDGLDVRNTILFFSLFMFNDVEIDMDCDLNFWKDWRDYFQEETMVRRNVKFTGKYVSIREDKSTHFDVLWYSGGKDSAYARAMRPDLKLIQFIAQVYGIKEVSSSKKISGNFDNEIFHCRLNLRKWLKTELFFPLISPYQNNYFGYEKEVWENSKIMCNYDLPLYQMLFREYNMIYDSPSKETESGDIIKYLFSNGIDIVKCDSTDYGKDDIYCYGCQKCITAYAMGCNLEEHGFDRSKMYAKMVNRSKPIFKDYVKWYCEYNGYPELLDYFIKIAEEHNVS